MLTIWQIIGAIGTILLAGIAQDYLFAWLSKRIARRGLWTPT